MDFPPLLRDIERKSGIEGTTKPRGGHRYLPFTVTVYLLLAKNTMPFFKTAKQRYNGGFERKSGIEGTTKEGDTDTPFTVTVYFLAKNLMSLFETAKGYRWIFHENQLLRAQKQEWDTDIPLTFTVYLFLAKKCDVAFYFDWIFTYVFSNSSIKNSTALHMHDHVCMYYSKKQPTNT